MGMFTPTWANEQKRLFSRHADQRVFTTAGRVISSLSVATIAVGSDDLKQKFGGIEGLPTTLLYDRDGILRNKVIGFEYTDIIESELKPLLDCGSSSPWQNYGKCASGDEVCGT